MPRRKASDTNPVKTRRNPPAMSPEAREQQMINLATNCAEQQMRDGTASSQVIVHYLKLATTKERLEREKLEEENKLLRAKTEQLKSQKRVEELYADAIAAMQVYSGRGGHPDEY